MIVLTTGYETRFCSITVFWAVMMTQNLICWNFKNPAETKGRKKLWKNSVYFINRLRSNKQSELPAEVLLIADKYKCSSGCVTETLAGICKWRGTNLDDVILSVNTVGRRRSALRQSLSTTIDNVMIKHTEKKLWALHWDGKMLKPLNHVGKKEEMLAVLLNSGKDLNKNFIKINHIIYK